MATVTDQPTATTWGHPRGLAYLSFTEMWERFSFYGMSALLTLYMVKQLLLPEHAANVAGLAALRTLFEFREPMSDLAFAALIYGWYSGLVYFTPVIGGWIADRWLGKKRTVTLGAVLMSGGHLAMTFDATFLVALLMLILGSGCLKGNISAQVGSLYPREATSMRDRGFAIFSTGINVGAASGPLVTGALAAIYGWHAGFALAAALMLLALGVYLAGQRHLPATPPKAREERARAPLTLVERRQIRALVGVVLLVIPAEIAYPMVWSIGIVWVDQQVALGTPLGTVPAAWFSSLDSLGSILSAPILIALWWAQARRGREPDSIGKIAIGTALVGCFALVMAAGSASTGAAHNGVAAFWAITGYLGMGVAWMYYWPTTLALVSRIAPAKINSAMVSGAFLGPFVAHVLAGWIGSYYDRMSPAVFWTLDAAIALIGALLLYAARPYLNLALAEHRA